MDRKARSKILKNRVWKSRCFHRLKGRPEEINHDYFNGLIDEIDMLHRRQISKKKHR